MKMFRIIIFSFISVFLLHSPSYGDGMKKNTSTSVDPIRTLYAPGDVSHLCAKAIQDADQSLEAILKTPKNKITIENSLLAFERILANLSDSVSPLSFMGSVATDPKVNNEGSECSSKLGDFFVKTFTREDFYALLKNQTPRDSEERRLLQETLKEFEKNGLKVPKEQREQVRTWMQELHRKEVDFSKNLAQDTSFVEFTPEELKGLPDHFLARLEKKDGKYKVTTKSTDCIPVLENAISSETRRKMQFAYMNRAAEKNTPLLTDAIELRRKTAEALGFQSWVDYQTQDRMAGNAKNVKQFLTQLKTKLAPRFKKDMAQLLKLKKKMEPGSKDLKSWDTAYYAYQIKKKDYHLDDEKIREYFPADQVIEGMFRVYSKLLGVSLVEVKGARAWAPGVRLYEIKEARTKGRGDLIGYFYTDFLPRPLKYGHAAAFTLKSGRRLERNSYNKPVSAIVANFNPGTSDIPSLLNHSEVVTLFHEFGHIMHQTLTQAPFASLSGSNVARDFVEAPSQMLENWVWTPEIVQSLSGHYKNSQKKFPSDMLDKLIAARDFNQGYFYYRQLYFGFLDFNYHTTSGQLDVTSVSNQIYEEVFGIPPIPGGHFPATFGHLMGGYDAGYYGYLWSEVYAADMFSRFRERGVLNPELGLLYRRVILERGNMNSAVELLHEFLGREPNQQAFLKKLHIN